MFLESLFHKTNDSIVEPIAKNYKHEFECIMMHIDKCVSQSGHRDKIIDYVIQVIVEHLNYSEATESLTSREGDEDYTENYKFFMKPFREIVRDLNLDNRNYPVTPREISIGEFPILLNPWNGDRVISNLLNINDKNEFDWHKNPTNIFNTLVKPLGIIACNGGNHSQLAAIHKQKGVTIINYEYDISNLYELVSFDGIGFVELKTNEYIFKCTEDVSFFAGVIFELRQPLC